MKVKLSTVRPHPDNPRVIKDKDFESLVKSIVCFPEMQTARPIVVNQANQIIGGNQRRKAFQYILAKSLDEIAGIIATAKNPADPERVKNLIDFWDAFKTEKTVEVYKVDWNEEKQKEFMIKDNVANGDWDYDMLANEWDAGILSDWGVGVWQGEEEAPEDLTSDAKNKPPVIKITLQDAADIEKFISDIKNIMKDYDATYAVSGGEL